MWLTSALHKRAGALVECAVPMASPTQRGCINGGWPAAAKPATIACKSVEAHDHLQLQQMEQQLKMKVSKICSML